MLVLAVLRDQHHHIYAKADNESRQAAAGATVFCRTIFW